MSKSIPSSSTKTLVAALNVLATEIQSGDGVANAAIQEAAFRLESLDRALRDAISTYQPDKTILVSAERQEAWIAALNGKE